MKRLLAIALGAAAACSGGGDRGNADAGDSPVEFTDLRVEEIGPYRAVVRFRTSVPTSCDVVFGEGSGQHDRVATDPDMEPGSYAFDHEVPLEDLRPDTTYYFAARAALPDDSTFLSPELEFRTLEGQPVDELRNVALLGEGTSVTAVSSNYGGGGNDSAWGADKAIDGLMSTEWSSAGDGDGAFLELDLGQPRRVEVIGFRSRMMLDGSSIVRQVRLIFDEGEILGPYDTPDPDVRYLFELEAPRTVTRVRLEAVETTGGNTGVKELELYSAE